MEVQVGIEPPRSIVSAAGYLPAGPLASLTLGNGVVETRLFDSRYFPDMIDVAGHKSRTWDYQTDDVGNVTQIDEVVACSGSDLVLDDRTVSTTEVFESCGALTVGPDFYVEAPGDVTLRAAGTIGFRTLSGVSLGASLRVQPDADLGLPSLSTRTFAYQDYQYFLISGHGPWGTPGALDWTYDTIGNRLSESRDCAAADTYVYETNTAGTGNRSRLDRIDLGMMGIRDYSFGDAGHLDQVAAGANVVNFTSDEEGRLAGLERLGNTASMRYDGRSFLERVDEGGTGNFTEPTYSSEGILMSLFGSEDGGISTDRRHVLYFAGRPVGILEVPSGGSENYTFVSTDHLGTPFVATYDNGLEVWSGGLEPFGQDWREGSPEGAQENGVFLRFPGQWFDGTWTDASMGAEVVYNVHRWFHPGVGAYVRPDPIRQVAGLYSGPALYLVPGNAFVYSGANPLRLLDPQGLAAEEFFCVLKYTLRGAGTFGLAGLAAGCAAGAVAGLPAGGVGAIPGCGAFALVGGGIGAAVGAVGGAFLGSMECGCLASEREDERTTTHEHCRRLYEICVSTPGRHKFEQGKRCQDCFRFCRREGEWPFYLCRLNYYPHGI